MLSFGHTVVSCGVKNGLTISVYKEVSIRIFFYSFRTIENLLYSLNTNYADKQTDNTSVK